MNSMRINKSKLIMVFLFLFALNAFDLSGVLISFTILAFFVFYFKRIVLDRNAFILIVFSLSYCFSVFCFERISIESTIKYALAPWGCYLIGYHLPRMDEQLSVKRIAVLLMGGFFLHGLLNLIASIRIYGIDFSNPYRYAYDFWQNRQISVTTAALYYSPLALLCVAGLFTQARRWEKACYAGCILFSLFATIQYQNRTLLLAMSVIIVLSFLTIVFNREIELQKRMRIVGGILVVVLLILIAWVMDFKGLRTLIEGSRLYERMTGEGQDRTKIWASFIFGEAWKYPFGGNKAVLYNNKPFVHNLWLDVFRRAGLIPFSTLILFTVRSVFQLKRFSKVEGLSCKENQQMIMLGMLGLAILFCVEPVIEANPYAFYIALIIIGSVFGSDYSYSRQEGEK